MTGVTVRNPPLQLSYLHLFGALLWQYVCNIIRITLK